jgi:hypothetical protein
LNADCYCKNNEISSLFGTAAFTFTGGYTENLDERDTLLLPCNIMLFFFFSFGVLQLMLPETPQPYGLFYYPHIGHSNCHHQFRIAMPPKQRKLEL